MAAIVALIVVAILLLVVLPGADRSATRKRARDVGNVTSSDIDQRKSSAKATGAEASSAPWLDPMLVPDSAEWAASSAEELCSYHADLVDRADPAVLALTFSPSPDRPLFDKPLWLELGEVWVPLPSRRYELRLVGDTGGFLLGLVADDVSVMISQGTVHLPLEAPGMPEGTTVRDLLFEGYAVDGTEYRCDPRTPADSARLAVALATKPVFAHADDEDVTVHADMVDGDAIAWVRRREGETRVDLATTAGQVIVKQESGGDVLAIPAAVRDQKPAGDHPLADVSGLWARQPGAAERLLTSPHISVAASSRELLEQLAAP